MPRDNNRNALKVAAIQANLEAAMAFADLVLQSDDELEILCYTQKAYDAYEEALGLLNTAALTNLEWDSIKTKMEHLAFLFAPTELDPAD